LPPFSALEPRFCGQKQALTKGATGNRPDGGWKEAWSSVKAKMTSLLRRHCGKLRFIQRIKKKALISDFVIPRKGLTAGMGAFCVWLSAAAI
jgi:hypothetical protein